MTSSITTPRQIAVGLSAAVLAALTLGACSSSSHPSGPTTGAPAGGGSSTTATTTETAPTTSAATTAAGGSGGGGLSLSGSFCSVAKKVQAEQASSVAAATDSPDTLKSLLTQANQELATFEAIAPSAIKGDVQVVANAEKSFFTAIAAANYDVTKISPSALGSFDTPAVTAATDHITSYLATSCGIVEPTDGSSS